MDLQRSLQENSTALLASPFYPGNNYVMSYRETPPGLAQPRLPLDLLAAAGFLSALGARIVDSLLVVLARDFQTTVSVTAILVAAFTLPYGLNQLILGPLSDHFGKLRVLLLALTGYTIFMTACGFAGDLTTLTILRACAGACSAGLIPTCLAYIGDSVAYEHRQVALSRFLTGVVLAQIMAGPIGGLFGELLGWRSAFLLLGGLGLMVAIAIGRRMTGLPETVAPQAVFSKQNYVLMLRDRPARLLLLVTVVEGMALPGAFPFLAPYMTETFGLSYLAVGLILSAFGLGAMGYTYFAPAMVRVLGEPGLVLVGGGIIAGSLAIVLALDLWPLFILLQIALGLGYFMLHSVMQARATELLPEARATAVSSFVFMLFLGQSLGALAVGAVIAWCGYRVAFMLDIAAISVLTLSLFGYMRRSQPRDIS